MMDRSAQLDELDSLKSIFYNEEFQVTYNSDENENIETVFWAFCKLPDDYIIKYINKVGSHEPLYLKIKHLPPIELRLTLPKDYPSTNPPQFVISCQWLPKTKISLLCKKLDDLWSEYGAVEIIYIWCDFLKNDSLAFLGYENELDLRELCSKHLSFLLKFEKNNLVESNHLEFEESQIQEFDDDKKKYTNTSVLETLNENRSTPGTSMSSKVKNTKTYKFSHNIYKKSYPYCQNKNNSKNLEKKPHLKNIFDKRAVLNLNIKTSPIRLLDNYNTEREKFHFLNNFHTCNICFSDKLGKDCTKFHDCNHIFCTSCIKTYFTIKIKDGAVQSIECPEDKCTTEALPSQIKEIVSEELFAKYDSVLLNKALDTLSDIIYCPRQLCQYPVSWDPEEKMASCPNCQYVFCVTCKMVYHGVEPCQFKSVKLQQLVEEYENASGDTKLQLESKYGKKHLEGLVSNAKAEAWIKENSKACPKCEVAIEKFQGCNKMVCWKCNANFCWLCSSVLDGKNPYSHYNDPFSKCANKLFYLVYDTDEEEDDNDWDWVAELDDSDSEYECEDVYEYYSDYDYSSGDYDCGYYQL